MSRESQPTESPNDAEARADFWSIQGDFIYRYRNEPRVRLYVLKEETFLIHLKYSDVTKSTLHWSGRHARRRNWRLLECRFEQALVRPVERFHEVYSFERKTFQRIFVVRWWDWQRFKRQLDQVTCGQKYGRKLVKPLRVEKNPEWKTRDGWKYCAQKQGETRIAAIMFSCSYECCVRKTINIASTIICRLRCVLFAWPFCAWNCLRLAIQRLCPRKINSQTHDWARNCDWCFHHSKLGQQIVFTHFHFAHQSTLMSCLWQQTRS